MNPHSLLAVARDRLVGGDLQGAREIIESLLGGVPGSPEVQELLRNLERAERMRSAASSLPVAVTLVDRRHGGGADFEGDAEAQATVPGVWTFQPREQTSEGVARDEDASAGFTPRRLRESSGGRGALVAEGLVAQPPRSASEASSEPRRDRHRWLFVAMAALVVGVCLAALVRAGLDPSAVEGAAPATDAADVEQKASVPEPDVPPDDDRPGDPGEAYPPLPGPSLVEAPLPEPPPFEPLPPPPEIYTPPIDEVALPPEIQRVAYCGLMLEVVAVYTDNPYLRQSTAILSKRLHDLIGGLAPEARGGLGVGEAFERALAELEESVEAGATRSRFVTCITWFGNSPNPDAAFDTAEQAMTRWAGRGYPGPEMSPPVPSRY